jgi:DNA-binding transcriptional MerR regulator
MTKQQSATLDELIAERDRLTQRQEQIERLLADKDAGLSLKALHELVQERSTNAVLLDALEPRIASARADVRQEQERQREAAVRALRPAERAAFKEVLAVAEALHEAIVRLQAVYGDLAQAGGMPLTAVPADLVRWVEPGLQGGLQWWAHTVTLIET